MKTILISLAVVATASAFANEAADDRANRQAFSGAATRAEVRADYLHARDTGTLPATGEVTQSQAPAATSGAHARDEVRHEARQAARRRVIHELL